MKNKYDMTGRMKKHYVHPQATVVELQADFYLLTGSNYPEERDGRLRWRYPADDDEFEEYDEIA